MKVSIEIHQEHDKTEIVKFTLEGDPNKASSQEAEYWAWMKGLFTEKMQKVRRPSLAQRILGMR
jgi:hypothetical protein